MKVVLPFHPNGWQQFVMDEQISIMIVIIVVFVIGTIMIFNSLEGTGWCLMGTAAILSLSMMFTPLPDPKDEGNAYSDSCGISTNCTWNNDESIWNNDKLRLDNSHLVIAKAHRAGNSQIIKPLNETGRAWMIVANKIQAQPKPHKNIKMDIHLAYTQGSVETPQGTKKFICYVNKPNDTNKGYQVLKYK